MKTLIDKNGKIAFFGRLSLGNFVDWLVTLCLGLIIGISATSLGGVRPEAQLSILPLFGLLLTLHGIWLAVDRDGPKRLSHVPFAFLPALVFLFCSALWWSPVAWLGWYEVILALELFIFFWVLVNNVRSLAHLRLLLVFSLIPSVTAILSGCYQYFQDPSYILSSGSSLPLELNSEFYGRAMGTFGDPNAFAAFLLTLLPFFIIAGVVRRLPIILRILSIYIALLFLLGIAMTQAYWAIAAAVFVLGFVPWFCFRKLKQRVFFSLGGVGVSTIVSVAMFFLHPPFQKGVERAISSEGEGVRAVLWSEAIQMTLDSPIIGQGAGAFGVEFAQSERVSLIDAPVTPHSDLLLLTSQYGVLGAVLVILPFLYICFSALRRWRKEPFRARSKEVDGFIMPPQRFFLSLGLSGILAFSLCASVTFVFQVPAIALYGVLAFSILVKASFKRRIRLPEGGLMRLVYPLIALTLGFQLYAFSFNRLEAHALELQATEQLEHGVEMRVHVSGSTQLIDDVIELYEDAVFADPQNADAWIGLSASTCQLYFQDPSGFRDIVRRATDSAERACSISPSYWKAWAQLGIAQSFAGQADVAEASLSLALAMAPNNSNAHYYYAAFLGADGQRRAEAVELVRKALEINPGNVAARRLERKLLIL